MDGTERAETWTDFKQLAAHVTPADFKYSISIVATIQVEVLCVISTKRKRPLREVNELTQRYTVIGGRAGHGPRV